jgi:hypothetical protein
MAGEGTRFVGQLDGRDALRLRALAGRKRVSAETVVASLLSRGLDQAESEPSSVASLLDSIPGAFDRANQGMREIRAGVGIPLAEF